MNYIEIVNGPKGETGGDTFDADTFLDYLRKSHQRWSGGDSENRDACHWVFRGHNNKDYKLIPTAAREHELSKRGSLLKQIKGKIKELPAFSEHFNGDEWKLNQLAQVLMTSRLLWRFAEFGMELGFFDSTIEGYEEGHVPDKILLDEELPKTLKLIGDADGHAFSMVGKKHGEVDYVHSYLAYPRLESQLSALAQHHGVPTYLLDWTENPWFAAYFASIEHEDKQDKTICVWALNVNATKKGIYDLDIITRKSGIARISSYKPSRSTNEFLASQLGVFTYIDGSGIDWDRTGAFPDLEAVVNEYSEMASRSPEDKNSKEMQRLFPTNTPILRKIQLNARFVPNLRKLLRIEGITKAHLMPTLDNVAQTSNLFALGDRI